METNKISLYINSGYLHGKIKCGGNNSMRMAQLVSKDVMFCQGRVQLKTVKH